MRKAVFLSFMLIGWQVIKAQPQELSYSFQVEVSGSGQPVLLIPGLACRGEVWQQTVDSLRQKHTCHVLTLPGFAGQPPVDLSRGYLPVVREEIENYIRQELADKPVLIGHSLGGFLAMQLAAANPGLVSKLVVVDSYPFLAAAYNSAITPEEAQARAQMMRNMVITATDSLFSAQQMMTLPAMINDTSKVKLAYRWALASDRTTIGQALFELMTTDLRQAVSHIDVPILVLGSWFGAKDFGITRDRVAESYAKQFSAAPICRIRIAETARHFIMWDDFDWFYPEVDTFIGHVP